MVSVSWGRSYLLHKNFKVPTEGVGTFSFGSTARAQLNFGCFSGCFDTNGSHGQLQNSRLLALLEECQKDDLAIRKFQSVMMDCLFVFIDLPKDCGLVLAGSPSPWPQAHPLNFLFKGQLRPRHKANCDILIL
jgi:hypothetical protein